MVAKDDVILPKIQQYLNSKLMNWYYRTVSVRLGSSAVRMFSIYVLNIPIPHSLEDNIYMAYHLTQDEIAYIENREF